MCLTQRGVCGNSAVARKTLGDVGEGEGEGWGSVLESVRTVGSAHNQRCQAELGVVTVHMLLQEGRPRKWTPVTAHVQWQSVGSLSPFCLSVLGEKGSSSVSSDDGCWSGCWRVMSYGFTFLIIGLV